MRKAIIIIFGVAFIMLLSWPSTVLGLLVTGHIPGTSFTIPFWAMMAVYCLLITLIVTLYIEDALGFARNQKSLKTHTSRMPHRRFGHI